MTHAVNTILRSEGPLAFYKGLVPSLAQIVPGAAIQFGVRPHPFHSNLFILRTAFLPSFFGERILLDRAVSVGKRLPPPTYFVYDVQQVCERKNRINNDHFEGEFDFETPQSYRALRTTLAEADTEGLFSPSGSALAGDACNSDLVVV